MRHDWDHILKSGFLFQAIFKQPKLNLINNLQQGERSYLKRGLQVLNIQCLGNSCMWKKSFNEFNREKHFN